MMCIAVVGGAVAALVLATKSPIALTGFAYVATHLLAAAILIVPFSIVCVLAKLDPPPFAGLWSMLLLVVIPAVVTLILSTNYYSVLRTVPPTDCLTSVTIDARIGALKEIDYAQAFAF